MRVLKKKLQRKGVFREAKAHRSYEKPSQKRAREKAEAIRRSRKAARKFAQREGLIPGPKRKPGPAVGKRTVRIQRAPNRRGILNAARLTQLRLGPLCQPRSNPAKVRNGQAAL